MVSRTTRRKFSIEQAQQLLQEGKSIEEISTAVSRSPAYIRQVLVRKGLVGIKRGKRVPMAVVKDLLHESKSVNEIADVLNRDADKLYLNLINKRLIPSRHKATESHIKELHAAGMSPSEIADRLHICISTVYRNERKLGLKRNSAQSNDSSRVLAMLSSGHTVSGTARSLHMTYGKVYYIAYKNDLTSSNGRHKTLSAQSLNNAVNAGKTIEEMADIFGVDIDFFTKIIYQWNEPSVLEDNVRTLIDDGKSNKEIKSRLRISQSTLGYIMRKNQLRTLPKIS
jgi:DNA-binding CsgD family transcriptional regulator